MPMFKRGCVVLLVMLASACGSDSSSTPTASSPTVTSLSIVGSPVAAVGGAGYQFLALVQYSNLTSADVTTSATWTSSNNQIAAFATVGGRPVLNTFQRGTVTITASYGGKTATLSVSVS